MKKIFTLIFLSVFCLNAINAEVTWELSEDGTLTISGTGKMKNYGSDHGDGYYAPDFPLAPWYSQRESIKNVIIENGVTSIGNFAFHNCIALTSITIPNSVTNIYAYAFSPCTDLTSITIPNSVTNIDYGAFNECTNLNKVTIEVNKNLEIGNCAFYDCGVEMLIMNGETLPKSVDDDFISAFNTTSLYVPSSLYEEYRSTSPWNKFVNIKIIDDENTGISKSELDQPCNSTIYDVNGRKVVKSTLKPGLYIRNGQKVVVK